MSSGILPLPALVVLVGPSGAGKTAWAEEHFVSGEVVSSDRLRAVVGTGESDLRASAAAFEVLHLVVRHRLAAGLTTVVDTLGLDPGFRSSMLEMARAAGMTAIAVLFDVPPSECRARNRARSRPVPAAVLDGQLKGYRRQSPAVGAESWDLVFTVTSMAAVSERPDDLARSREPVPARGGGPFRYGLVVSSYPWAPADTARRLAAVAAAAVAVGFDSMWVMDHLIQIPQVGRRWDAMLEGPTTLAWLAGVTDELELGTLVANASLRNPAHLAKIVATLDVLSDGRARCGLGTGWWGEELEAYGSRLPSRSWRLDRLEDCLELLPKMWGPGKTDFAGRTVTVRGAECYPRPLQDRIPIMVGGQGRRRTLQLAARYADGVNLRGEPEVVAAAVGMLHEHCRREGRSPDAIEMSHLSWPLAAESRAEAGDLRRRHRRGDVATVAEHRGRLKALADLGITEFLFAPVDLADGPQAVERLEPLLTMG